MCLKRLWTGNETRNIFPIMTGKEKPYRTSTYKCARGLTSSSNFNVWCHVFLKIAGNKISIGPTRLGCRYGHVYRHGIWLRDMFTVSIYKIQELRTETLAGCVFFVCLMKSTCPFLGVLTDKCGKISWELVYRDLGLGRLPKGLKCKLNEFWNEDRLILTKRINSSIEINF